MSNYKNTSRYYNSGLHIVYKIFYNFHLYIDSFVKIDIKTNLLVNNLVHIKN